MDKISVVVLSKNEEENIEKCLDSVRWADEVIVVDDYSEDKTIDIIKKQEARSKNQKIRIYKRRLNKNFAEQRNYGINVCSNQWILFIDSDEVVSEALANSIEKLEIGNLKLNAYKIKRIDYLWGRKLKYGEVGDAKLTRLVRKGTGKWVRRVHERWESNKGIVDIGEIEGEIRHYPHKNISEFLEKIRKYAILHAEELEKKTVKPKTWQIIIYPLGKFFYNYIWKRGFLDGTAGFIHAAMMSFHSFIARSKLWLSQKKS